MEELSADKAAMDKFMKLVCAALQGAASNTSLSPKELAHRAISIAIEVGCQMADYENEAE
jgi:hypothetical protein